MNHISNRYYKMIQLLEDEEILDVIHQSIASIWYKIMAGIILALLPFFLMFYLIAQGPVGSSIFFALIALAIFYIFREWYIWSRNVFLVTNMRVVDYTQTGIFHRSVSEVSHQKIQDVSYHSKGFFCTLFGIGNILIKTSIPDLRLGIYNVGNIEAVCARLSKTVSGKMGRAIPVLQVADDESNYDEYELKDLIEHYIDRYSRAELKKMLYKEIERADRGGDRSNEV